jgi:Resolvase, N terminal domain
MKPAAPKPQRCAIYTRKSSEHNLDLEFNSLDAQREACEAYIKSQAHEGWRLNPDRYDDGGHAGASLDRPALKKLLTDVRSGKITIVVVYKVDRLTRSLADFASPPSPRLRSGKHFANGTSVYWHPSPFCHPESLPQSSMAPRPADLTVTGLAKTLPYSWAEQERRFGLLCNGGG